MIAKECGQPPRSSFANWMRFRSPPEQLPTIFCWSGPLKLNRATYARLATRFTDLEAAIPLPARRQATQLVESLWRLAQVETDQRRAEPVRQELGSLQHELARQQSEAQRLASELAAAGGEILRSKGELGVATTALIDQKVRVEELVRALADLKVGHAGELATLRDQSARALNDANEQHREALAQLRRQLDEEVARSGSERHALLQRVDQAQVETRQWMAKEHEAQAATQRALAALGDAKEAAARAAGELTLARAAEKRSVDALAKSEAANAAAVGEGLRRFIEQSAHYDVRLVRDFTSTRKLARPDWLPARDWALVVQAIGGAKVDGQAAVVQELAAHLPVARKRKPA